MSAYAVFQGLSSYEQKWAVRRKYFLKLIFKNILIFSTLCAVLLTFITIPLRDRNEFTVLEHLMFSFFGYFSIFFFGILLTHLGGFYLSKMEERDLVKELKSNRLELSNFIAKNREDLTKEEIDELAEEF